MLALVVSIAVLIWKWPNHWPPEIRSLAVLPLENLSSDPSQEYFADGMTDKLITALGQISTLHVISRTSVMLYQHVRKPLPEIARELKVDAVVERTVLRSGEQVRITAQLIRATTDEHLWSQSYEGDVRDTLQLQGKVARTIADRIYTKLSLPEQVVLNEARIVNPDAHDAYLTGRYFWNKRTEQSLKRAIEYFNQAIAIDPNYARAYSGLAESYALLGNSDFSLLSPREAYPRAKAVRSRPWNWTIGSLRHIPHLRFARVSLNGTGVLPKKNIFEPLLSIRAMQPLRSARDFGI